MSAPTMVPTIEPLPALQRGAADHHRGDGFELEAHPADRLGRTQSRGGQDAGDADEQARPSSRW